MRVCAVLAVFVLVLAPSCVWANEAVPTDMDPVHQKRAVKLEESLRCLVCQNQTIADSSAELAQDLRRQVREQIAQGRSDKEIVAFMVQRYGDFVLYNPPVKTTTLLLWFGPALLLLAGIAILFRNVRVRRQTAAPTQLSLEERERAKDLLDEDAGKAPP